MVQFDDETFVEFDHGVFPAHLTGGVRALRAADLVAGVCEGRETAPATDHTACS